MFSIVVNIFLLISAALFALTAVYVSINASRDNHEH